MEIKFGDIVKWKRPMNGAEERDVMIVEDILNEHLIEVRHISGKKVTSSNERVDAVKVVGHSTPTEPIADILKRYNN